MAATASDVAAPDGQTQQDLPADVLVAALIALYLYADIKITALVMRAITKTIAWTPAQLASAIFELRTVIAVLDKRATPLIVRMTTAAYAKGALDAESAFKKAGIDASAVLTPTHQAALLDLASKTDARMRDIHQLVSERVEAVLRAEAAHTLTQKASGAEKALPTTAEKVSKTAATITEDVARQLDDHGLTTSVRRTGKGGVVHLVNVVPITGKDGKTRNYSLGSYAQGVGRTQAQLAHSQGVANSVREASDAGLVKTDLVHTDQHPGGDDAICGPLEGRTFSLFGQTPGYPVLPALPPWHINCRHYIYPVLGK